MLWICSIPKSNENDELDQHNHDKKSSLCSFPYYLQPAEKHAIHTNKWWSPAKLVLFFCQGDWGGEMVYFQLERISWTLEEKQE